MDLIRQLGPLALASRFRRLADWLYKDVPRIYRERSADFEPRWFPLFYLLKEAGPISVTAAASALGYTHPAINQIAGEMAVRGLLESVKDKKDERKRLLRLTRKGRAAVSRLEPVWADIGAAAAELVEEAGADLLAALGRLEDALEQTDVYQRVMRQAKKRQSDRVEIVDYKPQFKRYFKSLNLEWLRKYFAAEDEDLRLLSDPHRKIVKAGGSVLFARLDGKIVGTTALLRHDRHTYELTKMAVTRHAQGRQAGRRLALAAIQRARKAGAKHVVLVTSPRLNAACNLYRSLGFVEVPLEQTWTPSYRRESIAMSLDLRKRKH